MQIDTQTHAAPGRAASTNGTTTPTEQDHVNELAATLGEGTVLLPIPVKTKSPNFKGWQKTTYAESQSVGYQQELRRGNIGVLLGAASNGLCAIDIDDDARLEPFLDLNPKLRATLITKGKRGGQIWVRVEGQYPAMAKLRTDNGEDFGEWRADRGQSVIHGLHPEGMRYQRLNDANPIKLQFSEIEWPSDIRVPWGIGGYDELVKEHGPAYRISTKGGLTINDHFFVGRFTAEHPILFEPLEEEFYQYDRETGLWRPITEDAIKRQFAKDLKRAADDTAEEAFCFKRGNGQLTAFANLLRGQTEQRDAFKKRVPIIHLANGMLDLTSDKPQLLGFHPDFHSRNICPIPFDPTAQAPRFLKELLEPALDAQDIHLLQRWAGSILLGNNPAQKVMILTGTAGGGKSTLVEVIEKVIGERNVTQLRTKHLHKQFELYKYLGKTLLTGKDVNGEFLNEDGADMIKALVGNDLLDAEKKFGNEQFQLRGNFNVAITCNSTLRVRLEGDSAAWARRLLIINYTKPKPKVGIPEFADKLIKEEGPGILNWLIEGAIMYLQDLNENGTLTATAEQRSRVDLLLAASDSVRQFVSDQIVESDGSDVTVIELQNAYYEFCEERGWRAFSSQEFRSSLEPLMLELHRVGKRNDIVRPGDSKETQRRGFKGVRVLRGGH